MRKSTAFKIPPKISYNPEAANQSLKSEVFFNRLTEICMLIYKKHIYEHFARQEGTIQYNPSQDYLDKNRWNTTKPSNHGNMMHTHLTWPNSQVSPYTHTDTQTCSFASSFHAGGPRNEHKTADIRTNPQNSSYWSKMWHFKHFKPQSHQILAFQTERWDPDETSH